MPAGTACDLAFTELHDAVAAAGSGATIKVGPGSYPDGPYVLAAGVSIQGSGAGTGSGATALTLGPGAQTYLTATQGTISDLRVVMTGGDGATGIAATSGAIVDNVVVFGPGSTGSTGLRVAGSQVHDVTVNVTGGSANTAVSGAGGNVFTDSTWNGGSVGYRLTAGSDTITRGTVRLAGTAALADAGTLSIDDSVLDLGADGSAGLVVRPAGVADPASAVANHLTVVGGAGGSRGVVADASAGGARTATLMLANSVVWGPATSLVRDPGGSGTASLTVSRSDHQTTQGGVTDGGGNLVGADPAFVNPEAGDHSLRATSPVVDKGVASAASKDRAGHDRSVDGDHDGVPVPDLGAYELVDVNAPRTVITGGPSGPTNDNSPVFTFRSGPDVTFECQIDGSALQPCASPVTTTPLTDGPHSFKVRATDPVFNVEESPATRSFAVDTVAPDTSFIKKAPKRFFKQKVKFKFVSTEPGARFKCRLDNLPWRSCSSPFKYGVKRGKHRLLVRAVDAAGNADRSPARFKFKRLPRHHR